MSTSTNISSIRNQIELKTGCNPQFGTLNKAEKTITDFDHFPYTRFYRGIYNSSDPIVIEREAGWRPRREECYTPNNCGKVQYPNHCFETSCSTTFPCYPAYVNKISDRDFLNLQINRACIVQYR